ncbi:MAG: hypothetical protein M1816_004153 [Peltula sp. TS41687]|nr:MAG: hypothetical protein M1816_004153 [Peltula sp. TS41687]
MNQQRAVKKLLLWVTFTERLLTVAEMEHAMTVSRGATKIDKNHVIRITELASLSAGLISIDNNQFPRLTHETAENYFRSNQDSVFPGAELEIAERCLAYLQLDAFSNGPCLGLKEFREFEELIEEYPFLEYAALYWGNHARRSSAEIIAPAALMFLRSESHLASSVQAMWYTDTHNSDSWDVEYVVAALHIVAFFGLKDMVDKLIVEGTNVNMQDSKGTTPLHYAVFRNFVEVVDMLLRAGASSSVECDLSLNLLHRSWGNLSALMIAATYGYTEIVKLLLAKSNIHVNQEASHPRCWTALFWAIQRAHKDIAVALLAHPNVDKDHQNRVGETPLMVAIFKNYPDLVELLVDAGADPERKDLQGGTALQRAVDCNYYSTVKWLVQRKVNRSLRDCLGRTLLHSAAVKDRVDIMRFLLKNCQSLNINAQGDDGETALHDSARLGFIATSKVLLEFGARTDVENKAGRTAARSVKDANNKVFEILREARDKERIRTFKKADTFSTEHRVPFWIAVQQDDEQRLRERISRMTLDELNARDPDSNQTPLHHACRYRRANVIKLLLEAGVNLNPCDSFNRTPLVITCQMDDIKTLKHLVACGADVHYSSFRDMAPWEIALTHNKPQAAIYLISEGAHINEGSGNLHLALQWAVALGSLIAVRRLVEVGVPVQSKDTEGATLIQLAKAYGHSAIEQYLFEEIAKQRSSIYPNLVRR